MSKWFMVKGLVEAGTYFFAYGLVKQVHFLVNGLSENRYIL